MATTEIAEIIKRQLDSESSIKHRIINENAPDITMDASLARRILGWEPKVSLKEGLKNTIEGFR